MPGAQGLSFTRSSSREEAPSLAQPPSHSLSIPPSHFSRFAFSIIESPHPSSKPTTLHPLFKMQYSSTVVAAATLFSMVQAVIITNTPQSFVGVTVGQPLEITWSDANGPVTLKLKNGPSTNLNDVLEIASGQTGTSYTWTPASTLPEDTTYAIEIEDSTDTPNYTVQFPITGGTGAVASYGVSSAPSPVATTPSSAPETYVPYKSAESLSSSAPHPAPTVPANTTTASSTMASVYPTNSANGTVSTSPPSSSNPSIAPPNNNSAGSFASPLAFVFLAFAGLLTLN
ncbi:hypothetical protein LZ554_003008 [Drepanopeziza brunnea f. sp. 'monogermtubi']|nr:hypothetical protein LZ554_003008 [Drepanopeziza brunnea f. sp. 'monogermtubi']